MGSRILAGRYELLERIGEGGMAVVFKAKDRLLNRMVAIKILKPEFTKDEVFIESFRRESQLAASIVHQNIVNVYDVGKEGNIHYIVMEHIDGLPLSDIIREEAPLEPHRAVSIAKQIASALSAAHNHQLIHRDVKPHNILLTQDGIAKITDFGIAKAVTTNTFVGDEKEAVMGSVHYFSPEQARGAYVDERSDIYSLGIVMYEMLTGSVPFDGDTAVEVAVKHMNEEMVPPSKLNPEIPQDIEDIILKATDKIQVNRFKNADDLILALNFVKFSKLAPQPEEPKLEETPKQKEKAVKASKESKFAPALITNDDPEEIAEEAKTEKEKKASSGKSKKKRKGFKLKHPQVLIAILIALIAALPAAKFLGNKLQIKQPAPSTAQSSGPAVIFQQPATKEVTVPRIIGLTEEEARGILERNGLDLKVEREVVNDNYRIGEIVSQTPSEDSKVKTGYTIKVNICKGKADDKVPTLTGKTLSSAKELLREYGYAVGSVTEVYDDVIEKGFVITQNPASGKSLAKGGSINLTVSLGPEEIALGSLDLIDITLEEALEQIESLGMTVGSIQYVSNATVEKDHIINQNPGAGVVLEEGQAVDLVVSSGNEEEPQIDDRTYYSLNIDIPFDAAEEDPFDLIVIVKDEGSEPSTFRETHYIEEMMTTVTVTGATENAKVLISFGNKLVYQFTVNFPAGTIQ